MVGSENKHACIMLHVVVSCYWDPKGRGEKRRRTRTTLFIHSSKQTHNVACLITLQNGGSADAMFAFPLFITADVVF